MSVYLSIYLYRENVLYIYVSISIYLSIYLYIPARPLAKRDACIWRRIHACHMRRRIPARPFAKRDAYRVGLRPWQHPPVAGDSLV